MHYTDKTHFFRDADDNRTVVITTLVAAGEYQADLIETTGGALELLNLSGHGATRMEAIADLREAIERELNR